MYDYMFYGASMFPSNGNHLVRAVNKGRMTAIEAVDKLIDGDHAKALGKLMAMHDKFNADTRKQAFDKVITARKLDCFVAMYENDAYSKGLNTARQRLLMQLFEAGWQEALEKTFTNWSRNSVADVFKFVTLDLPDDLRRRTIGRDVSVAEEHLLDHASRQDLAWMPYFLDFVEPSPNANKLGQLAVNVLQGNAGDADVTKAFDLLLSRGMNVNYDNGAVMAAALAKGRIDLAQQLVEAGFEAALCSATVYERLCASGAPRAGIDFIKQFTGTAPADAPATQDGFTRSDDYSVSCVQALPGGGQLTMMFNFATAQQIVIAQMGEQMAAPAVVPFSHIENRHLLEKAATAFVAGGGDAELASASAATTRKSPLAKPHAAGG